MSKSGTIRLQQRLTNNFQGFDEKTTFCIFFFTFYFPKGIYFKSRSGLIMVFWEMEIKSFPFISGSDNWNGAHVRPEQRGARDDVTRCVGSQKKKVAKSFQTPPPPPVCFCWGEKSCP